MANPVPFDQLRTAAICAVACMRLDAAREYGFIEGGPEVHVGACEETIARAKEHGMEWTDDEVTETARQFMAEWNEQFDVDGSGVFGDPDG